MTDFFTRLIAEIVEKFKVANPKTFAAIALVLLTLIYGAQQGTLLGIWEIPGQLADAIVWLGSLIATLLGSQTFRYLPPEMQKKRNKIK